MTRTFFLIILYIFSLSCLNARINTDSIPSEKQWIVKGFINDQAKLWTSPLSYKKNDLTIALPVISATTISFFFDKNIQSEAQNLIHHNNGLKHSSSIVTNGGGSYFAIATCGLFYFGGMAFHNDKARQTGFLAAYALLNTSFIVTPTKYITGRQRPIDNGNDTWRWLSYYSSNSSEVHSHSHTSFPSGHAAVAWTLASVISTQYKEQKYLAPILYTLASAVSLSRISENKHWTSDVIIGSAIGFAVGKYIVNHHHNKRFTLLPPRFKRNIKL